MSTGEKRMLSARRGMTVLGKIPAVPKPINLPSQRLENRGLDVNVEIVPRGTTGWGTAGRSPPVNTSPWGKMALSSSPPIGSWSTVVKQQGPSTPQAVHWGSAEIPARPSSAESDMRPSSAPASGNRFWGGTAKFEEQSHFGQFNLTNVDFPLLGSEKNPSLRPQHGAMYSNRPTSADGKALDNSRFSAHEVLADRPTSADGSVSDKKRLVHHQDTIAGNRPTSADGNSADRERLMINLDVREREFDGPGVPGRYSHPVDYGGQPLVTSEMLQMDGHIAPVGLGVRSHHPVQYGYYKPPGVLQYANIDGTDPSRGSMMASHMFLGSHAQLRPLMHFGQPGFYDYRPQRAPPAIYSRPDLARSIRPSGTHQDYPHQIYGRGADFEAAGEYGMQQEDWRCDKDLSKQKMGNSDALSVSGAQSSSGRVKGINMNGHERMELTTEVGALVRTVGRGAALRQSQTGLETSTLSGQPVNLINKESQSNYFQESVPSREHRSQRKLRTPSTMEQEQLKELPGSNSSVRIFTSKDRVDLIRDMKPDNVKEVSTHQKSEVIVLARPLNNASVNIGEYTVDSSSKSDAIFSASTSLSGITSAHAQNDKKEHASSVVAEGLAQSEQPMVKKHQFGAVTTGGFLGSVYEQQALGSPLSPGMNVPQDETSQYVKCLGDEDTSNVSDFEEEEKSSGHHRDEHIANKQIDLDKGEIEPTNIGSPNCKNVVSLYPADSNTQENKSGATVPELLLVFGAVDEAITASLVGASKMGQVNNSAASETVKKGCKTSLLKTDESGDVERANILTSISSDPEGGEPINQECASLPVNREEAEVVDDDQSKSVKRKSNPPRHTHKERSFHVLHHTERSNVIMKWAPVRASSNTKKDDDGDVETVCEAQLPFSKALEHVHPYQPAGEGQQKLEASSEQAHGIKALSLQPPPPASKADFKVEQRKYKSGSVVHLSRHLRKEDQSSMDSLVETIKQTSVKEVNKELTESQFVTNSQSQPSKYRAKQVNYSDKSLQIEEEVHISSNTVVPHEDTKGKRAKKKSSSFLQQDPLQLQDTVAKPSQGSRQLSKSEETPAEEKAEPSVGVTSVQKTKMRHEKKAHFGKYDRLQPEQQQDSPGGHKGGIQNDNLSRFQRKENKEDATIFVPKHRQQQRQQHSIKNNEGNMDSRSCQEKEQEPCMLLEPIAGHTDKDGPNPTAEQQTKNCNVPCEQKLQSPHGEEKLLEEVSSKQKAMSVLDNDMSKTKPYTGGSGQRGQRHRRDKSILEVATEKGVHVTDNPVVSGELKERIESVHSGNKEETKHPLAKANKQQHLTANNLPTLKSSVREQREPTQLAPALSASVPEARKKKEDRKLYIPKLLFEQQGMQQQQTAANIHEVGTIPSKELCSEGPIDVTDRKRHHGSWMSKTDGITDESTGHKQGLLKDPLKDAQGSAFNSYWRKGRRQPVSGVDYGKQQTYVRKVIPTSDNDKTIVHSSTEEVQTSKHKE